MTAIPTTLSYLRDHSLLLQSVEMFLGATV